MAGALRGPGEGWGSVPAGHGAAPSPRGRVQPCPAPTTHREPLAPSHRHRHLVVLIHTFPLVQDGLGLGCVQLQDTVGRGSEGPPALPSPGVQHPPPPPGDKRPLTHFISRSVKMRLSRHMRSGTVRMRMKGKAREATVDMTAQSTARQASCSPVNRCMRRVRTWAQTDRCHCWSLSPVSPSHRGDSLAQGYPHPQTRPPSPTGVWLPQRPHSVLCPLNKALPQPVLQTPQCSHTKVPQPGCCPRQGSCP